ncbi:hypothetical protein MBLNU459_g3332t2 [Dothideomycetes sp. NU459]
MSSPAPVTPDMDASQASANPFVDIPTRPMRVKVLYTFDNDNKTNCLARFPDILNVPTVPIDETTQIGVIELRTCIRAIVSASPELISRLNQGDFTIYAYDYSEYESPLVGQGMLSSALAAASSTPAAPAYQSKTMITGRVCKNIMGLFSNGVKETLEVKLRLVPVPKPVQSEFVKSMEMYRTMNPAMSAGFDPNAWSQSLQGSNLALGAPFEEAMTPTSSRPDMVDSAFDSQNTMSFQPPRQPSNASFHPHQSISGPDVGYSAPVSRVNSPAIPINGPQQYQPEDPTRPSSRTSVRSERMIRRRESFNTAEQCQEDGPARKRVKVVQTDWRGKTSFGAKSDSLRVTASTAASIRIHKPVPKRPGMPGLTGASLEPPPRVPTPVPGQMNNSRPGQSFLRRESSLAHTRYMSPYGQPCDMPTVQSEALMSSPEEEAVDGTVEGTPTDFPSSPPMMPEPSSPGLPSFHSLGRPADSGYMSSNFECQDDDEDRSVDEDDLHMAAQYRPRPQMPHSEMSFIEQTPGPPELLPQKMQMAQQASKQNDAAAAQAELSRQKARNAVLAQTTRRSSLALPPKPPVLSQGLSSTTDGGKPAVSRSSSNNILRSEAASPAPSEMDPSLMKLPRSGSGAKRKKTIQDQLQKSIENGEMPTFCGHCGAIETPTWRHLFTKVVEGCLDESGSDIEGVTMGTEVIERDPKTDAVLKYRVIKSMRKSKDSQETQGFETLQVCNPCGLWFNKFKVMRPPEKWIKKQANGRRKQQRKANPPAGPSEPQSDYFLDQPSAFYTDAVQPEEDNAQTSREPSGEANVAPMPFLKRARASSVQPQQKRAEKGDWTGADLDAALNRAIQSSPARFLGTQESPIDLDTDLTPKPTRRLLFPSPRKSGEMKSLDDAALPGSKPVQSSIIELAFVEDPYLDKENCPPPINADDDLAHLFGCSPKVFKTPFKTPPKGPHLNMDTLLQTPTPARSSIRMSARQTRTPSGNQSTFLPTFTSSETKALFPVTPSRYANLSSPSRAQMTPFTRHLSQLLSDANCAAPFSSPGRPFDFSDLPTFMTPGRNLDFSLDDFDMINVDLPVNAPVQQSEQQSAVADTAGGQAS